MSNFLRFLGGAAKEVNKRKEEKRKSKLALEARLAELKQENQFEMMNKGFNIGGIYDPNLGRMIGGINLPEDFRTIKNDDLRFNAALDFFRQIEKKDKQNPGYKDEFLKNEKNRSFYDSGKTILENSLLSFTQVGKDQFRQKDITPYKDLLPSDVFEYIAKSRGEYDDHTERNNPIDNATIRLTGALPSDATVNKNNTLAARPTIAPATEEEKAMSVNDSVVNKDFLSSSIAYNSAKNTGFSLNNPNDPTYKLGSQFIDLINDGKSTVGITHYASSLPKYKDSEVVAGYKISKKPIQDPDEFAKLKDFHRSRYIANRQIYETVDSISRDIMGYVQPNESTGELEYVPGIGLGGSGLEWQNIKDNYFSKDGGFFDQISTLTSNTRVNGWTYSGERNRQIGSNLRSGMVDEKEQESKYGMSVNTALAELENLGKAASVKAKLIGLAFQVAIADQDYQGGKAVSDADFQRAWRKITGGAAEEGSLITGFVNPKVLIKTLETVRDSIARNGFESYIISQNVVGEKNAGFTEIRTATNLSDVIARTAQFNNMPAASLYNQAMYGENKSDPRRHIFSDNVAKTLIEKNFEDKEFTGVNRLTDMIGQKADSMFALDKIKDSAVNKLLPIGGSN